MLGCGAYRLERPRPGGAGAPSARLGPAAHAVGLIGANGASPTILGIGQVSLLIRDIARATHFYGETLGLEHLYTYGDLAFFDAAGTRLYLHRKDEAERRLDRSSTSRSGTSGRRSGAWRTPGSSSRASRISSIATTTALRNG